MSGSRLDSSNQAVQQAMAIVSKLKEEPKTAGFFSRLAFLFQAESVSPTMVDRLCAPDPTISPMIETVFAVTVEQLGLGEVPNVAGAMNALGPDRTGRLLAITGVGVFHQFASKFSELTPLPIIKQSAAIACVSSALASSSREISPVRAYQVGALTHIGVGAMSIAFGAKYHQVYQMVAGTSHSLAQVEREHFGISHSEFGAWFGALIGLNPSTCQVIREHHEPLKAVRGLSQICALSELVAHDLGYDGGTACASPGYEPSWTIRLGLQNSQIPKLIDEISFESALFSKLFSA